MSQQLQKDSHDLTLLLLLIEYYSYIFCVVLSFFHVVHCPCHYDLTAMGVFSALKTDTLMSKIL